MIFDIILRGTTKGWSSYQLKNRSPGVAPWKAFNYRRLV